MQRENGNHADLLLSNQPVMVAWSNVAYHVSEDKETRLRVNAQGELDWSTVLKFQNLHMLRWQDGLHEVLHLLAVRAPSSALQRQP